jgi:hypothetical protein
LQRRKRRLSRRIMALPASAETIAVKAVSHP